MIKGKKPKFGVFREKSLLCSGSFKEKDEKDFKAIAVKFKCDKCGEPEALTYQYMDRFAFFGKDQIAPNPRVIITEECDNCGAIYFLDQHPVAEMVSNLKTNKASSSLNRDSSDTERKKSRLDFDVYDDGDYLIM